MQFNSLLLPNRCDETPARPPLFWKKTAVLLFVFFWLFSDPLLFAQRILTGEENSWSVASTDQNYYLASLISESDYYDPTFYDDFLIRLDNKTIAHFTKVAGVVKDFYFYVTEPEDIAFVRQFFKEHQKELDDVSPKIIPAFRAYAALKPSYTEDHLADKVAALVKSITHTTLSRVVADSPSFKKMDLTLFGYLRSNGVASLKDIGLRPTLVNMLINKFFMLSTTHFYRDYAFIKKFRDALPPLKERAGKENRPLKLKVYACSSGEEVMTYAVELLDAGIENFTILASDINPASLEYAKEMRYPFGSFDRLPFAIQKRLKKYFRLNPSLNILEPMDPGFFKERIHFTLQDLLQPLPANLEKRFAPPYDLVSILNVLLYLEDAAVQKNKDYWAGLLNPDGILILHDAKYNLSKGWLDHQWTFKRFQSLNEWVNVKVNPNLSDQKKVTRLETLLDPNSQFSVTLLSRAYALTRQGDKGMRLCEDYLQKHPFSFDTQVSVLEHYEMGQNLPKAQQAMAALIHAYPQQMTTLSKRQQFSENLAERLFLSR